MKSIKNFFLTAVFLLILSVAVFIPGKVYSQEADFNRLLGMVTGITLKITPVDPNIQEMPTWFGVIYDVTNMEEAYPAFANAECFAGLPCYKIEMVPKWNWLYNFLSNQNVPFPTFYGSDLIPEMTPAYIEANCGQMPAQDYRKKWSVSIVADTSAYAYELDDVYCTGFKVEENGKYGPYISEVSFNMGTIVSTGDDVQPTEEPQPTQEPTTEVTPTEVIPTEAIPADQQPTVSPEVEPTTEVTPTVEVTPSVEVVSPSPTE